MFLHNEIFTMKPQQKCTKRTLIIPAYIFYFFMLMRPKQKNTYKKYIPFCFGENGLWMKYLQHIRFLSCFWLPYRKYNVFDMNFRPPTEVNFKIVFENFLSYFVSIFRFYENKFAKICHFQAESEHWSFERRYLAPTFP